MPHKQNKYKLGKTIAKALIGLVGGSAGAGLVTVIDGLPNDLETLKTQWPLLIVPVVSAVVPAVQNAWKHRKKLNFDLGLFFIFAIAPLIVGCATFGQAVTTTTITYPDGTIEVMESSEFDPEAWDAIMESTQQLAEAIQEYREQEAEIEESEREAREQELRLRAELLQTFIQAAREEK